MSYTFKPYLSVGIDVGADFSIMSMALPKQQLIGIQNILSANKKQLIVSIAKVSRKSINTATKKYESLIKAAGEASTFGHAVDSNFYLIQLYIDFIQKYDAEINHILEQMHQFVNNHEDKRLSGLIPA